MSRLLDPKQLVSLVDIFVYKTGKKKGLLLEIHIMLNKKANNAFLQNWFSRVGFCIWVLQLHGVCIRWCFKDP